MFIVGDLGKYKCSDGTPLNWIRFFDYFQLGDVYKLYRGRRDYKCKCLNNI